MKQLGLALPGSVQKESTIPTRVKSEKLLRTCWNRHFQDEISRIEKWVTDVTEFKVNDQKLYLSPILDLFNGEVVSYTISSRHPNFKHDYQI